MVQVQSVRIAGVDVKRAAEGEKPSIRLTIEAVLNTDDDLARVVSLLGEEHIVMLLRKALTQYA